MGFSLATSVVIRTYNKVR